MSGEYWKQIDAETKRQERESLRRNKLKAVAETRRLIQERRLADELREAREGAITLIQSVFEDVRRHSPEISHAPMSIVERYDGHSSSWFHLPWSTPLDVVALKWGNKLGLTDDEKKFLEENEYWKETQKKESRRGPIIYSVDLPIGRTIPDEVVGWDYQCVQVFVSDQEILPPVVPGVVGSLPLFSRLGLSGFVADPSEFLSLVPSLLSNSELASYSTGEGRDRRLVVDLKENAPKEEATS